MEGYRSRKTNYAGKWKEGDYLTNWDNFISFIASQSWQGVNQVGVSSMIAIIHGTTKARSFDYTCPYQQLQATLTTMCNPSQHDQLIQVNFLFSYVLQLCLNPASYIFWFLAFHGLLRYLDLSPFVGSYLSK